MTNNNNVMMRLPYSVHEIDGGPFSTYVTCTCPISATDMRARATKNPVDGTSLGNLGNLCHESKYREEKTCSWSWPRRLRKLGVHNLEINQGVNLMGLRLTLDILSDLIH